MSTALNIFQNRFLFPKNLNIHFVELPLKHESFFPGDNRAPPGGQRFAMNTNWELLRWYRLASTMIADNRAKLWCAQRCAAAGGCQAFRLHTPDGDGGAQHTPSVRYHECWLSLDCDRTSAKQSKGLIYKRVH